MFAVKVAPTELFIWQTHAAELCIRMGRKVTLNVVNLVAFTICSSTGITEKTKQL